MKKLFAVFIFIVLPLWSQSYNEHILKIEANIIPRIILMDYNFEDKLVDGKITITVLHNPTDLVTAQKIEKFLQEKYPKGLKHYPIAVRLLPYAALTEHSSRATLYYLMDSNLANIKNAIGVANRYRALTFSHDSHNLRFGAHISLRIDKKIIPYINPASLKQSTISLRPALLAISELFQ